MIDRQEVRQWLELLKSAWEAGETERAVSLFSKTERYYERPFRPGTTAKEIRSYWTDIDGLEDITFDYSIVAVEGDTACVHWQNKFHSPKEDKKYNLDGIFTIEFDDQGNCKVFRQWWFME